MSNETIHDNLPDVQSEPVEKMMTEIGPLRYFLLTTLAATLIPPVILLVPILVAGCFSLALIVTVPTLIVLWKFAGWMKNRVVPRFHAALLEDRLPKNAFVLYSPVFLPFLYVLAVTACGFSGAWDSMIARTNFFLWALAPYIVIVMPAVIATVLGAGIEVVPAGPLLATFFAMVGGAFYLYKYSPRRKGHLPAVVGLCALCVAFVAVIVQVHGRMREYSLSNDYAVDKVQDETDLRPYIPFSTDNKLETVEGEVRLHIKSKHPRLHGALALYPVYAAAAQEAYKNITANEAEQIVRGGTSPKAFSALIEGGADMVFMLRPSEKQFKEAEAAGKTLTVTPIGREAFVFFVSSANPVDRLSSDQIREIYSKQITNWRELGGKNKKILPFQRPEGSGSQTAMQRFMDDRPLARPIKEEYQELMGGIVNRVADYRNYANSIGYSFRYYVEGMFKHDGVKLLAVDGIEPSPNNIRNGTYPLTGEMAIVTAGSENQHVPELIEWFLSPPGQELIERVGYVSLH